ARLDEAPDPRPPRPPARTGPGRADHPRGNHAQNPRHPRRDQPGNEPSRPFRPTSGNGDGTVPNRSVPVPERAEAGDGRPASVPAPAPASARSSPTRPGPRRPGELQQRPGHPHAPRHTSGDDHRPGVQWRAAVGHSSSGPGGRGTAGPVLPPAGSSTHVDTGGAASTGAVQPPANPGGGETPVH